MEQAPNPVKSERLQKLKVALSKRFQSLKRYLNIRFKLYKFRTRNYFKYKFLKRFSAIKLVLLFGLVSTAIIAFASGKYLNAIIPQSEGASQLFALGSMIVGVLAIVFTLSTIILTNTLDKLPTALYSKFIRDKYLDLLFFIISAGAITIFLFGLSYQDADGSYRTWLFRPALIIVIWVIIMIYFFYRRVQYILSPIFQILYYSKSIKDDIDEMQYLASKHAEITAASVIPTDQAQLVALRAANYRQLANHVDGIKLHIAQLVIMHNRAYKAGDVSLAGDYRAAIFGAIIAYVTSRKDSSFAEMSKLVPVPQSDSALFIENIVEKLVPLWVSYLKENDLESIRDFLRYYKGIVAIALQVDHPNAPGENPAYHTAFYSFRRIVQRGIQEKNVDAMFESANILWQIAKDVMQYKFNISPLEEVLKELRDLFIVCAALGEDPVANEVIEALQKVFESDYEVQNLQNDDVLIKYGAELIGYVSSGIGSGTLVDIRVGELSERLLQLAVGEVPDQPSRADLEKVIRQSKFFIKLASSAYASHNGKSLAGQAFNRALSVLSQALLDIRKDADDRSREEIDELLKSIVSTFTLYGTKKEIMLGDHWHEDLADAYAKVGLYAVHFDNIEVADKVFDNLRNVSLSLILNYTETKSLYGGLRMLAKSGHIAVAIKAKYPEKFDKYKDALREAEKQFVTKYFENGIEENVHYSPSPFAIRGQFDDLMKGETPFSMGRWFEHSDTVLMQLVSVDDVESFVYDIWPKDSSPTEWLASEEIQNALKKERANPKVTKPASRSTKRRKKKK